MLSVLDGVIIFVFLMATLLFGILNCKKITLEDYLVNRRSTNFFMLLATILSTFIGGATIVGIVSMGYTSGFIGAILGLSFALGLIATSLAAPYIKKMGDKYGCYTLPDILAIRFSNRCRAVAAVVNLVVFFFFMAIQFIAFGTFLTILTNWSLTISIIFAACILLAYTSVGGLHTDIKTDVFQLFVMLPLFLILFPMTVTKAGGFHVLYSLPKSYFSGVGFGGPVFIIGAFLFLAPSVLVSMDIWQRIFSAKNERTARNAFLTSAILIIPLFIVLSLLGMFAKILFPNLSPDTTMAYSILSILPYGFKGLAISGFIAALMSTADSMLVVVSATVVHDLYHSFLNKNATKEHILKLLRRVTLLLGIIGIFISILIPNIVQLIVNAFSSLIILLPATIGGLFWKRATSKGAFWSILIGFISTLILAFFIPKTAFIPGFFFSLLAFIIISLHTKHEESENKNLLSEIRSEMFGKI